MSLVEVFDAEWRTRKIDLVSLLFSFATQLKPGQDLTKVSLPSVLCYPFSVLELLGYRHLRPFVTLYEMDNLTNPIERFLCVVKWFTGVIKSEDLHKKPYNPVIGESHICWIDHGDDDKTEYVAEQVSHHPPISALHIRNTKRGYSLTSNCCFGVKFGRNYVSVPTSGTLTIKTKNGEVYEASKIPDLKINNVIGKGKKYIMWEGETIISCVQTGYTATIRPREEKNKVNILEGTIAHVDDLDEVLYNIGGVCGEKIYYWPVNDENKKVLLADHTIPINIPISYLPENMLDHLSSTVVWSKVNEAIIKNDMTMADAEKKRIEADQRKREAKKKADRLTDVGTYFYVDPNSLDASWEFKENVEIKRVKKKPVKEKQLEIGKNEPEDQLSGDEKKKKDENIGYFSSEGRDTTPTTPPDESNIEEKHGENKNETLRKSLKSGPASNSPPPEKLDTFDNKSSSNTVALDLATSIPVESPNQERRGRAPLSPNKQGHRNKSPTKKTRSKHEMDRLKRQSVDKTLKPTYESGESEESEGSDSDSDTNTKRSRRESHLSQIQKLNPFKAEEGTKIIRAQKKEFREEQKQLRAKVKEQKKQSQTSGLINQQSIVKEGSVKIRNSFKKWNERWAILINGQLIYFKNRADAVKETCSGIINLKGCYVTQRPSKKAGYCIKIFNVHKYDIYSHQDLRGRVLRTALLPAASDYCLIRLKDKETGKEWLKALISATPDFESSKSYWISNPVPEESESSEEPDEEDSDDRQAKTKLKDVKQSSEINILGTEINSNLPNPLLSLAPEPTFKSDNMLQEAQEPYEEPIQDNDRKHLIQIKDAIKKLAYAEKEDLLQLQEALEKKIERAEAKLSYTIRTQKASMSNVNDPKPVTKAGGLLNIIKGKENFLVIIFIAIVFINQIMIYMSLQKILQSEQSKSDL